MLWLLFVGETRGIGGIFFDDLDDGNQDELFKFVTVCQIIHNFNFAVFFIWHIC